MWQNNDSWIQGLFSEVPAGRLRNINSSAEHDNVFVIFERIDKNNGNDWHNLKLKRFLMPNREKVSSLEVFFTSYYVVAVDTRLRSYSFMCAFDAHHSVKGIVNITIEYTVKDVELLMRVEDPLLVLKKRVERTVQDMALDLDYSSLTAIDICRALLALDTEREIGIALYNSLCGTIQWSFDTQDQIPNPDTADLRSQDHDSKKASLRQKLESMGISDPAVMASMLAQHDADLEMMIQYIQNDQQDNLQKQLQFIKWLQDRDYISRADLQNSIRPLLDQLKITKDSESEEPEKYIVGGNFGPGSAFGSGSKIEAEAIKVEGDRIKISSAKFSSYAPSEVSVDRRYGLYVYAYNEEYEAYTKLDIEKFKEHLGGTVPKRKEAKTSAEIEVGTKVTVIPECDEIEFEPESLSKKWHGDWTQFGFEFRAPERLVDETLFVRISVQIAGIEIAHIKSSIEVVEAEEVTGSQQVLASNPLLEHKMRSQTVTPYQRIFISYSRRDSSVAKSYKIAQTALGNDAFLDVDNLRSGEDWRAALARAIDEADIFQLFWSEHSANSEYCRYEWDYALKVRCPEDTCEGFVRPVYWREPMPSPPPELARINFRFVPFGDQDD